MAIFFVLLAVTGVLINHAVDLSLDKKMIPAFLARAYVDDINRPMGISLNDKWLYGLGGKLYLEGEPLGDCYPKLDAVLMEEEVYASCGTTLLILTREGELLEAIADFSWANSQSDLGRLLPPVQNWPALVSVDASQADRHIPVISWERFLLDVHSGTLFGGLGILLLDLIALLVIVSAVSGWMLSRK